MTPRLRAALDEVMAECPHRRLHYHDGWHGVLTRKLGVWLPGIVFCLPRELPVGVESWRKITPTPAQVRLWRAMEAELANRTIDDETRCEVRRVGRGR